MSGDFIICDNCGERIHAEKVREHLGFMVIQNVRYQNTWHACSWTCLKEIAKKQLKDGT